MTITSETAQADLCVNNKRKYPHKGKAKAAAKNILSFDPYRYRLFIYICPICGFWHITSKEGGSEAKRKTKVTRRKSRHPPKKRKYENKRTFRKRREKKGCQLWRNQ